MPKVSVIIPSYRREDWLKKTLLSVLSQANPDVEVIIVYQDETDNEALKTWCQERQIVYIFSNQPSTPRSRNLGVQAAKGEICVFFDDDVELLPGCLAAHLAAYQDPTVMGVAGRVITLRAGEEDAVKKVGHSIGHVTKLAQVIGDQEYNSLTRQQGKITPLGCNMSLRRSAIVDAGYYDESYVGNAMREETDLAVRILTKGDIVFEPQAAVKHFLAKGGSRQKSKVEWYGDYFFNEGYFIAKFAAPAWRPLAYGRLWLFILKYYWRYARSWEQFQRPWRQFARARQLRARGAN